MIFGIKQFKLKQLAATFERDLTSVIKDVTESLAKLAPYKRYKPVARIVAVLNEEKGILEKHLQTSKKIIKNKGEVDG